MINFKKVLALVLATLMITAMAMSAVVYADPAGTTGGSGSGSDTVSITISRDDDTYKGEASANSRTFTWYRVFTATYTANESTGGGYDASGAPLAAPGTSGTAVSYIASQNVASKLGSWSVDGSGTGSWTKASGNEWFTLTPIFSSKSGTGFTQYSVKWDKADTSATEVQKAAKWLKDNGVYDATGSNFTFSDGKWTVEGLEKGYYILESVAGDNLIAATTDINVKEKNDYPPLDKTQADEDNSGTSDENRSVAIGDVLTYEVKVTIPKTAAVGDKIVVWDKASTGLTYNNDVQVKSNDANVTVTPGTKGSNYTGVGTEADADWNQLIEVTAGSQGKDIIFTFTMTVNDGALVDTGKENESALKYGDGSGTNPFPYESVPDKVEYETYFGGIFKIDGNDKTTALPGVKFDLFEAGVPFPVVYVESGSYYIPASSGSNEVVTDASGTIHIRGLDDDKTYTLTETYTLPGYNLLDHDVELELHIDTTSVTTYNPAETYESGTTYYVQEGSSGSYTYTEAGKITEEEFASGTYFTATTSSSGTYDSAVRQQWEVKVENLTGTILPSTGGIGTTIFYIVGGLLAVGAGVVLVSKKRMGKEDL